MLKSLPAPFFLSVFKKSISSETALAWKFLSCLFIFLTFRLGTSAEGSKELNPNGGDRAFLYSSTTATTLNPFPTQGLVRVYVKKDESIYVGSSAQGVTGSGGTKGITYLRSPGGTLYNTGTSTTVGLIKTRAQEMAGPAPNTGGYTPAIFTVTTLAEEGVWEVFFVGPNNSTTNPVSTASNTSGNLYQPVNSGYVAAFDVSVRNAAGTAFIPGRAYMNIFGACSGGASAKFTGVFNVLTKDGATYTVNANGLQGQTFAFFANNKGYKTSSGNASYLSSTSTSVANLQDPRNEDTSTDFTHKLFFNACASDLPASAPCRSSDGKYSTAGISGSTWLNTTINIPVLTDFSFTGMEGTANVAGTSPLGGYIGFDSNQSVTYKINLDLNQDGSFNNDVKDRTITGTAVTGGNSVYWDGLDGQGNKIMGSVTLTPSQVQVFLVAGEVHFPLIDVESNSQGIIITRTNGSSTSDVVYWNDSNISGTNNSVTGTSSIVNGHKWNSNFGDGKGIDTWTYILSSSLNPALSIQFREADLEIAGVSKSSSVYCFGQAGTYTVTVKNNGPYAVSGAKFRFEFPSEYTDVTDPVYSSVSGNSSITSGSLTANQYEAIVDIDSGAVLTFAITGSVTVRPAGDEIKITASILRPKDVTDPDATNPDSLTPTDPLSECNSTPSGTGCNNLLEDSTSVPLVPTPGIILAN